MARMKSTGPPSPGADAPGAVAADPESSLMMSILVGDGLQAVPRDGGSRYGSSFQRDAIFLPSSPGTHTTTTLAPAGPVLWRTESGGFTKPDMPGLRTSLLPFTTCSSSPETT